MTMRIFFCLIILAGVEAQSAQKLNFRKHPDSFDYRPIKPVELKSVAYKPSSLWPDRTKSNSINAARTGNRPVRIIPASPRISKQSFPASYTSAMLKALKYMAEGNIILEQDDNGTPDNPYDDHYVIISERGERVELTYREIIRIKDVNHRLNSLFATNVKEIVPAITSVVQGRELQNRGGNHQQIRNHGSGHSISLRNGQGQSGAVSIGYEAPRPAQRSASQMHRQNQAPLHFGHLLGIHGPARIHPRIFGVPSFNLRPMPFRMFPHRFPPHFFHPLLRRFPL